MHQRKLDGQFNNEQNRWERRPQDREKQQRRRQKLRHLSPLMVLLYFVFILATVISFKLAKKTRTTSSNIGKYDPTSDNEILSKNDIVSVSNISTKEINIQYTNKSQFNDSDKNNDYDEKINDEKDDDNENDDSDNDDNDNDDSDNDYIDEDDDNVNEYYSDNDDSDDDNLRERRKVKNGTNTNDDLLKRNISYSVPRCNPCNRPIELVDPDADEDSKYFPPNNSTRRSEKHRESKSLTFIHIPKTGGTSVDWLLKMKRPCHVTSKAIQQCIGQPAYSQTLSFAILRHPTSRAISMYRYALQGGNGKKNDKRKYAWVQPLNFASYVKELRNHSDLMYAPQSHFVSDANDNSINDRAAVDGIAPKLNIDHILCLESITDDWREFVETMDLVGWAVEEKGKGNNLENNKSNATMGMVFAVKEMAAMSANMSMPPSVIPKNFNIKLRVSDKSKTRNIFVGDESTEELLRQIYHNDFLLWNKHCRERMPNNNISINNTSSNSIGNSDGLIKVKPTDIPDHKVHYNPGGDSVAIETTIIPRVLHYTWPNKEFSFDKEHDPHGIERLKILKRVDMIRRSNVDWEIRIWTDEECHHLMRTYFSKFMDQYGGNQLNPRKYWDVVRLAILYVHGGIYLDHDVACLPAVRFSDWTTMDDNTTIVKLLLPDLLLKSGHTGSPRVTSSKQVYSHAKQAFTQGNFFMGSVPGHPFWLLYLKNIILDMPADMWVLDHTGPRQLANTFIEYNGPVLLEKNATFQLRQSVMHKNDPNLKSIRLLGLQEIMRTGNRTLEIRPKCIHCVEISPSELQENITPQARKFNNRTSST